MREECECGAIMVRNGEDYACLNCNRHPVRKSGDYSIEEAIRDISSIETVQFISKDRVRKILERLLREQS